MNIYKFRFINLVMLKIIYNFTKKWIIYIIKTVDYQIEKKKNTTSDFSNKQLEYCFVWAANSYGGSFMILDYYYSHFNLKNNKVMLNIYFKIEIMSIILVHIYYCNMSNYSIFIICLPLAILYHYYSPWRIIRSTRRTANVVISNLPTNKMLLLM